MSFRDEVNLEIIQIFVYSGATCTFWCIGLVVCFVDRLNLLLRHTIECGLMIYYESRTKRIVRLVKDDTRPYVNILSTILLKDLKFVFIIFLIGVSLSICVFTCEIILFKYQKRQIFKKTI